MNIAESNSRTIARKSRLLNNAILSDSDSARSVYSITMDFLCMSLPHASLSGQINTGPTEEPYALAELVSSRRTLLKPMQLRGILSAILEYQMFREIPDHLSDAILSLLELRLEGDPDGNEWTILAVKILEKEYSTSRLNKMFQLFERGTAVPPQVETLLIELLCLYMGIARVSSGRDARMGSLLTQRIRRLPKRVRDRVLTQFEDFAYVTQEAPARIRESLLLTPDRIAGFIGKMIYYEAIVMSFLIGVVAVMIGVSQQNLTPIGWADYFFGPVFIVGGLLATFLQRVRNYISNPRAYRRVALFLLRNIRKAIVPLGPLRKGFPMPKQS